MFKKYVSLMLAIFVVNLACGVTAFASNSNDEKEAKAIGRIKTEIAKIGVGKDTQVEVKLKDGTKIRGYVTEIIDESFTVINVKTNSAVKIPYSQAKQAKNNNSKKTIAVVGIVVGIVAIIAIVVAGRN